MSSEFSQKKRIEPKQSEDVEKKRKKYSEEKGTRKDGNSEPRKDIKL